MRRTCLGFSLIPEIVCPQDKKPSTAQSHTLPSVHAYSLCKRVTWGPHGANPRIGAAGGGGGGYSRVVVRGTPGSTITLTVTVHH